MPGHAYVRHCGSQQNSDKGKNYLIFQQLVSQQFDSIVRHVFYHTLGLRKQRGSGEPDVEPVGKVNDAFVTCIFIELFAKGASKMRMKPLSRS